MKNLAGGSYTTLGFEGCGVCCQVSVEPGEPQWPQPGEEHQSSFLHCEACFLCKFY